MSQPQLTADGTLVMPAVVRDSASEWQRSDLPPIVPCPEPDDEDQTRLLPALMPSFSHEIAQDPVILPMGRPRSASERLRLGLALLLSLAALGAAAGSALALL